ncbi:hypothetical protein [Nocardioides sp.]|uniref:hypothetical protein n=1 Tax=Nocardioides sp. TaxID=35761 RepID=UPI002B273505|nr:hypothetical protein [Nocardioides sp.]
MTPSTDLGDAGRHPVPPTTLGLVREALAESFTAAANALGDAMAVEADLTTGRIDLPPSDPDASDAHAVESSATRTATGELGTVVLHETRTAYVSGKEIRTTIALTGSSHLGERFWLGATSYDGGAVSSIELVGELADFAGSALADVLDRLTRLDPDSP